MTKRNKIAAVVVGVLVAISTTSPVFAEVNNSQNYAYGSISGLLIQYQKGTRARLANGLTSASRFSPIALREAKALGGGAHLAQFGHPTTLAQANQTAAAIRLDPTVRAVSVDAQIGESSLSAAIKSNHKPLVSSTIKPGAVGRLKAIDAWIPTQPLRGALQLQWQKPSNLAGGRLYRYQVLISLNAGQSYLPYENTLKTKLRISNLTPNKKYFFRVAAVVKLGKLSYLGKTSIRSFTATAAPRPPVLNSASKVYGDATVAWQPQNALQSGGLPTSYRVKVAGNSVTESCQSTATSCSVKLPSNAVGYRVSVTATNSKGSSTSETTDDLIDPYFNKQWYLESKFGINAQNAWAQSSGFVNVAVIDNGVTIHEDLTGALLPGNEGKPYGYDFVSSTTNAQDGDGWDADPTDPGDYTATTQSTWHGTHVTGLIAAAHNDLGIAGVAPGAKIIAVRAMGADGGRLSDLLASVSWAAGISVPGVPANQHRAKIINLSIASESNLECDAVSAATFRRVASLGAIVVTAAGNRSVAASSSFPANCPGLITVAATNFEGGLTSYSNYGNRIDIAAPGGDVGAGNLAEWQQGIISTLNSGSTTATKGTYGYLMGTSMAAPLVAGVLALMAQADPRLSVSEAVVILKNTAQPFAAESSCATGALICGPGIVNAAAAVELASLKNW
ncbi:MAG: hypothetical protein RL670_732 [Actinomycetota bacterium]